MKVLSSIFAFSLLSACGGGGGDGSEGTANARYNGNWGGVCDYDADFEEAEEITLSINGTKAIVSYAAYPTSNCSGSVSDSAEVEYVFDFIGTQNPSTGICAVDDKVNAKIISAKINDLRLTGEQINDLIAEEAGDIGFPEFLLFCVSPDGDFLYSYDDESGDGSTEANRPTQIDVNDFIKRQ